MKVVAGIVAIIIATIAAFMTIIGLMFAVIYNNYAACSSEQYTSKPIGCPDVLCVHQVSTLHCIHLEGSVHGPQFGVHLARLPLVIMPPGHALMLP